MEIKSNKRNSFIIVPIILIIVSTLPIINLDRGMRFSCISINKQNRIVLKCFAEPFDARFIREEIEIRINSRSDFLPNKTYFAKVYKVERGVSYYNGIAYNPIYCEIPEEPYDKEGIILDGIVKIDKISPSRLILVSVFNWLEPYSGEKIILY